jgi:hypothetical protein
MSTAYPVPVPARVNPHQRSWADLKIWRLGLGLVLAPLVPYAAMAVVGQYVSNGILFDDLWRAVLVLAGIAVAWSLIAGPAYLLTVVRGRRRTGRTECLLLGTGIAASLPTAAIASVALMPEWLYRKLDLGPLDPLSQLVSICLVVGLILAPFGLIGGWILWRVAVRPAPLPVPDVTAVFD